MYDFTSNNWSHRNSNKRFKETFESRTWIPFYRLTTTAVFGTSHHKASTTARNLKPERWRSPLFHEEQYREGKACFSRKRNNNNNNNNTDDANVRGQYIFHGLNNIAHITDCKYRTAATLYTLATWFVTSV
jgi:hypothetical protein